MSHFSSGRPHVSPSGTRIARPAFTLVEILVALVVSLILMGAVVSLFGFLGDTFGNAKADIEMSDREIHAAEMLQNDLNNLTVDGRPAAPGQPQSGALELIEARERDYTVSGYNRQQWEADPDLVKLDERLGDRDDILYMTLRNMLRPYVGKQGVSIPSGGDTSAADAGGGSSGGSSDGTSGSDPPDGGGNSGGVVDDGTISGSFSTSGSWASAGTAVASNSYEGDYHVSNTPGATATWSFTVATGGDFRIGITWPASDFTLTFSPRSASVDIFGTRNDNPISLASASLDQNPEAIQDMTHQQRPFQEISTGLNLNAGDRIAVTLKVPSGGTGYVFADAVKLESVNGGTAHGTDDPPDDPGTGGSTGGSTDGIGSGYVAGLTNESPLAEVIWFVTRDPNNPGRGRLHRYQLLIAPDADLGEASPASFFYFNDISARNEGGTMVANSLEDLSLRRFRRAHLPAAGVDSVLDPRWFLDIDTVSAELRERINETVVLDNVVAFDVQVYDEAAPIVGVLKPGTTSGFGGGGGGGGTGGDGGGTTGTDGGGGGGSCDLRIIDNGEGGFSTTGANWTNQSAAGYKGQHLQKGSASGPGVATWNFSGVSPGDYEVYVTWPNALPDTAATNAKFTVTGDGDAVNKLIDQSKAPSGVSCDGVQFQKIGTMTVTGTPGSINVDLDFFGADGPIMADAAGIKLVPGSGGGGTTDGGDDAGQSTGGINPSDGIDALVAGSFSLTPTDIRYRTTLLEALANADDPAKPQIVGYGAFVDLYQYIPAELNYEATAYPAGAPRLQFNAKGANASLVFATPNTSDFFDLSLNADTTMPAVYDTWSPWYQQRLVNQIDDDGVNGVDDPLELDPAEVNPEIGHHPPPYSAPLKAIRVTIRVYEPTSGSVREVTVQRSFDQD